jgi:glyoxylase-like metal-dependent hydrolase (beta-lactamase superfamily II)
LNSVSYLPGASNIGLAVGNHGEAILIDSGVGQRSGRQLLQLLEGQNLRLVAIFNTHGHGDHVGGNAYLVQHTGAKVYAPLHDGIVLKHPIWGTMCTFAGAEPIQELSSPRFAPEPCDTDVTVTQGEIQVAGLAVQVVPLPGHTGSHTGYIVDDVFFTGDILAGEAELAHAPISYAYSITQRLASLQKLRQFPCARYVLGHGPVEKDISSLIDHNIASITEVLNFVRGRLAGDAVEANELLRAVCDHLDIHIRNVREYYLLYPTLHAFLSHLDNTGEVAPAIQDNRLVWHTLDRR